MRAKAGRALAEPGAAGRSVPGHAPIIPVGRWDRRLLRPASSRWLIGPTLLAAAVLAVASVLKRVTPVAGLLALAVVACVEVAAAGRIPGHRADPATVSLNLGHALPLIRPNEAIDLLVGSALVARGLALVRSGELIHIRLTRWNWPLFSWP